MADNHDREQLLDFEEVLPIINEISIFAGLSYKQLHTLIQTLGKERHRAGEVIFREGEPPSSIYIVKSGRVKLVVNMDDTPLELVVFEEGQCFGETSVVGIQPHAASAVAVEYCELIVLSRNCLLTALKSDLELFSTLILNIAREACRRLHKADEVLLHYALRK